MPFIHLSFHIGPPPRTKKSASNEEAWKRPKNDARIFHDLLMTERRSPVSNKIHNCIHLRFIYISPQQYEQKTIIYFQFPFYSHFQTSSAQTSNIKLNQMGALAFNLPSNGSLSDSGISDSGGSSDYGLSDRERRLGALRRLAKQLELALVPGSAALNSITQRMEMAESELRSLQKTCRELIVRTAASQPTNTFNASENTSAGDMVAVAAAAHSINAQIPIINVKGKSQKRPAQT